MLSWFRRLTTVSTAVEEIDAELRKLAWALKKERLRLKAYGGVVGSGRYVLLLEDADDLLDRRLVAARVQNPVQGV